MKDCLEKIFLAISIIDGLGFIGAISYEKGKVDGHFEYREMSK